MKTPFTNSAKERKPQIRILDKEIKNFSEPLFQEARQQGINMGKNNPPKLDADISGIPFVQSTFARVEGFYNDISGALENDLQENSTRFEQACRELEDNKVIATLSAKRKSLVNQKQGELKAVDTNIAQERKENLAQQEKLEKQIKQNEVALSEQPYKNVFWPIVFTIAIGLGILASEVFVNQKAFLFQAGENFITSLVIAIGISLITFLMGLATAKVIQNKKASIKSKLTLIVFISLVFLGVAYGVAEMRTTMMQIMSAGKTGRASFVVSKFTLILINCGFYLSLVILKLVLIPSPKVFESNRKYMAIKADIIAKRKLIQQLQKELKELPKKAQVLKKAIQEKYAQEIIDLETELKNSYNEIKSFQIAYNKTLTIANSAHKQLSNIVKQAIGIFIQQINLFSADDAQIQMANNSISELENPFAAYKFIDAATIDQLFKP